MSGNGLRSTLSAYFLGLIGVAALVSVPYLMFGVDAAFRLTPVAAALVVVGRYVWASRRALRDAPREVIQLVRLTPHRALAVAPFTVIAGLLLVPCDRLPPLRVSVTQGSAVIGLAVGLMLVRRQSAERLVGVLNIAAAVVTLTQAIAPPLDQWCPCAVEIVAVNQTRTATAAVKGPIDVPCEVDIEGTLTRTRPELYTYVMLEEPARHAGEPPKFWPYEIGSRGRDHGNRVSTDWRGTEINLCEQRSQRSTSVLRAVVTSQSALRQRPMTEFPSHACSSRPVDVRIVEAVAGPRETPLELRRPLVEGMEHWLVFFLGESGNDSVDTIDSYSVVATVHYAGFREPIAKIDWGDGRGYRMAETWQGNPWLLTNTYATPGKKEVRFLIEARDGTRTERTVRIDVVPGRG